MNARIAMLVSGLAVGGLVLSSCGNEPLGTAPQSQAGQQTDCNPTVSIVANAPTLGAQAFQPSPITVARGATVTWVNNDSVPHTVTAKTDASLFTSGILAPGQSFTHTFDTAGTFDYFCTIHPSMTGTVVVSDTAGSCASPGPSASPSASPSIEPSASPSVEPSTGP